MAHERLDYEQAECAFGAIDLAEFVWFTGVGKSGRVAQRAAESFQSVGLSCAYVHATELLHGGLGAPRGDHALVAVSLSGRTEETVRATYSAIARTRIAVAPVGSPLAITSTHTLDPCVPDDADDVIPTVSLIIQSAVLDGLVSLFKTTYDVTSEDITRNHPGGTLGEHT